MDEDKPTFEPQAGQHAARQVAKQAQKTAESAHQVEVAAQAAQESAAAQTDSADRRTELAADRTVLAAERTYAAWVRTGMAALASGAAVHPLLEHRIDDWVLMGTATLFMLFAVFCFVAGVWRQLAPQMRAPKPDVRRLPTALLIGANGLLSLAAVAALAQLWFGGL